MFFRIKLGIWNISFLESKFFLETENRKESRKEPLPFQKRSFLLLFIFVLFCFLLIFIGEIGNWVKLFNNYSSREHR